MSKLTEGLGRIYKRFEAHEPHRAHSLQPPLSKEEIEITVQDLPFPIPPEVYELYQWRNGCTWERFLIEQYDFMPLGHAINEYKGWFQQVQQDYRFFNYGVSVVYF
jgi:cell wall assembly regulator SMI1